MRIGIAGLSHESNSFSTLHTGLDEFRTLEGRELIEHYAATYHEMTGFIAGASEFRYEAVPLFFARATPAGPVTAEAYEDLLGRLLQSIRAAGPLDGLLLALHGAMVAEGFPHGDAETVKRVRQELGSIPVVVTHDYHANISPEIVDAATALVVYKTNPHVDQRERGLQAASILARTVRGEVRPKCALVKPDVLFNISFHNTSLPPMAPVMAEAIRLEQDPKILACSIAAGYQYADVPAMGPSIVVVADGDGELARKEADRLGRLMWDCREELLPQLPSAEEAVRHAKEAEKVPVALFEIGDNIGGGSSGDATFILEQLMVQKATGWVVTLYDPQAVKECAEAGVGNVVELLVGGKVDRQHGPSLAVKGAVRTLHDGSYEETERRHGGERYLHQGLTAVLQVGVRGAAGSGRIVLNSCRASPNSIHQITCVGIVPEQESILVAKGTVAPRAAYEPVCAQIVQVDTPGATQVSRPPGDYRFARKSFYEWSVRR